MYYLSTSQYITNPQLVALFFGYSCTDLRCHILKYSQLYGLPRVPSFLPPHLKACGRLEHELVAVSHNDTTHMNDNLSLCDLLDDAVAAQCTTSALVTKIRQLIEENTRLKAELRRYRECEEIAHAEQEDAAPREQPQEPPREPPREPPIEPPLTPRPSTAYGVTPQEWMGMYPYRHQTPRSVAPSIAAAQEVPVHMWRTPRTTLPRHPLCHHPARSLTPDTVVHHACGVAAGTPQTLRCVATRVGSRGPSSLARSAAHAVAGRAGNVSHRWN